MVEILTWAGLLVVPAFLLLDLVVHPRRFDAPAYWKVRGLLVSAGAVWLSLKIGEAWTAVLPVATLFDLSGLGTWGGALVGILVYELFHYAYHRAAHTWGWLWRAGHQMHHSAEAVDAFGAWYLHPLDVLAFTSIGVLVSYPLLGLSPEAGAVTSLFLSVNAMFQHANLRTPRWLGWVIQRPESHGVHHARGVHRWNYSDLPLWDLVFGTFRNPARFEGEAGFYRGASARIPEMLVGRDVSRPRVAKATTREEPAAARPSAA